jgi:hypothetical protein
MGQFVPEVDLFQKQEGPGYWRWDDEEYWQTVRRIVRRLWLEPAQKRLEPRFRGQEGTYNRSLSGICRLLNVIGYRTKQGKLFRPQTVHEIIVDTCGRVEEVGPSKADTAKERVPEKKQMPLEQVAYRDKLGGLFRQYQEKERSATGRKESAE